MDSLYSFAFGAVQHLGQGFERAIPAMLDRGGRPSAATNLSRSVRKCNCAVYRRGFGLSLRCAMIAGIAKFAASPSR